MKEILLTCPDCLEPIVLPAAPDAKFTPHVCTMTPRRRFSIDFVVIHLLGPWKKEAK